MALTMASALTAELFAAIAAEMLIKADDNFTFLQHAVPMVGQIESGASTVTFNQPDLPTGTYSETSRRLTEGTVVSTTAQAITMTQKTLTLREYGGPHNSSIVTPFGITEKMLKMAKHDLASLVGSFLRRDRNKFLNSVRMDDMLTTTQVVIPGSVAEGSVTASQAASAAWLRLYNEKMKTQLVPTFPNGRWKLVIGTRQERELKADSDVKAALNYWAQLNPLVVSGQIGVYENFDIFVDTLIPTKGVGAGSAVTGYQSVAFGPYHLGHGSVFGPEPREADDTDFGRELRIMWLALEAHGILYPDYVVRGITT